MSLDKRLAMDMERCAYMGAVVFIVFFSIANSWKQPKYHSRGETVQRRYIRIELGGMS